MMNRIHLVFKIILITTLLLAQSCTNKTGGSAPATVVTKGSRKLGLHVTQSQSETFDAAFLLIDTNRFDHVNLHQIWGDGGLVGLPVPPLTTNAAGTTFDFTYIDIANAYYPAHSKGLMFTIGTIDSNNKLVPSSFNATAFDNAGLRSNFKTMLAALIPRFAATDIVSFQIGNEVDIQLGTNAMAWAQYKTFFDDVSAYAKTLRPSLKIGVTTTLYGSISASQKSFIQSLNTNADIVSVTYYPLNSDFTMKSPSVISADLAALVALYPTKSIYIQEIGYSSGATYIASSTEQQRQFVVNFFSAWDSYATNIPVVSWLNTTEWSTSSVNAYGTQYGICPGTYCNPFKEYLQTLGLRNYTDGSYKPAINEMILQMQNRGW